MSDENFKYRRLNDSTGDSTPQNSNFQTHRPVYKNVSGGKKIFSRLPRFPNFKKGSPKPTAKEILIWLGIGILGLIISGIVGLTVLIAIVSIGLPDIHDLDKLYVAQSTTIYDREGNILYVKYGGENRQYVSYEQMSKDLVNATVAIEDDQYWNHSGFDMIGITRALVNNVIGGSQQGGSTITQQYIKNAFLSSEKTYTRKLKELILAVQLEQAYDKEKILELYLNKIPYGNNAYGVEKASQGYFGKSAKELDLAEATVLASLPKAPTYYNPYGQHKYSELTIELHPDEIKYRNIQHESDLNDNEFLRGLIGKTTVLDQEHSVYIQGRTDLVLKSMNKNGYITEKEMEEALEKLQKIEFKEYREKISTPHFVFYVLDELEKKYGKEIVEQGGLNVYTTLDPKMQEIAETAIEEGVAKNAEKYNAKNGSLIALDPKTGEIMAMVGSKDYFADDIDGAVNITTQYRQPGSSFKPIVYAQAFYNRYAPGSIVFDVETRFGASAYPKNYDGTFTGPISVRKALAQSRNIPAIKAYFLAGEQEQIINLSQKMGIDFLDTDRDFGWPLALGTAEVRPLDIASAFGVFANNGVRHEPLAIIKVQNAQGEILEEFDAEKNKGEEVLDPQIAYLISDILSDPSVSLGEFVSVAGHDAAAKTGTSNRKLSGNQYLPHDLWTIGYTPNLVTAVWAGNNKAEDGNLAASASGYTASAPIWKKFMTEALENSPPVAFEVPDGITEVQVSKYTGLLPGPNTPEDQIISEKFASFSVPTEIDDSYVLATVDDRNNKLATEFCPEEFTKEKSFLSIHDIAPIPEWEEGAQKWMAENMGEEFGDTIMGAPPTTESELCTEERYKEKPEVEITSPKTSDKILNGSNITVEVKIKSKNKTDKVEYYLNDQFKYTAEDSPYEGIIRLPKNEFGKQHYKITVKAIDMFGYTGEDTVRITTANDDDDSPKTDATDDANNDDPKTDPTDPAETPPPKDAPAEIPPAVEPNEDPPKDTPPVEIPEDDTQIQDPPAALPPEEQPTI